MSIYVLYFVAGFCLGSLTYQIIKRRRMVINRRMAFAALLLIICCRLSYDTMNGSTRVLASSCEKLDYGDSGYYTVTGLDAEKTVTVVVEGRRKSLPEHKTDVYEERYSAKLRTDIVRSSFGPFYYDSVRYAVYAPSEGEVQQRVLKNISIR